MLPQWLEHRAVSACPAPPTPPVNPRPTRPSSAWRRTRKSQPRHNEPSSSKPDRSGKQGSLHPFSSPLRDTTEQRTGRRPGEIDWERCPLRTGLPTGKRSPNLRRVRQRPVRPLLRPKRTDAEAQPSQPAGKRRLAGLDRLARPITRRPQRPIRTPAAADTRPRANRGYPPTPARSAQSIRGRT